MLRPNITLLTFSKYFKKGTNMRQSVFYQVKTTDI